MTIKTSGHLANTKQSYSNDQRVCIECAKFKALVVFSSILFDLNHNKWFSFMSSMEIIIMGLMCLLYGE